MPSLKQNPKESEKIQKKKKESHKPRHPLLLCALTYSHSKAVLISHTVTSVREFVSNERASGGQ